MASDYDKDIADRAESFMYDNEEELIKALADDVEDFGMLDEEAYGYLGDRLREEEFNFNLEEAVDVIQSSRNVETDTGLWERQQPEDALIVKAHYTAQNDLRESVESMWGDLRDVFTGLVEEQEKNEQAGADVEECAKKAFAKWKAEMKLDG